MCKILMAAFTLALFTVTQPVEAGGGKKLRLGAQEFTVDPNPASTVFAPVDESPTSLTWEIVLPDLIDLGAEVTSVTALLDARRAGVKVGQVVLKWENPRMSSFTMTYVTNDGFTSVHVLNVFADVSTVVVSDESGGRQIFLVDRIKGEVLGEGQEGTPDEGGWVVTKPAGDLVTELAGLREPLQDLTRDPQILFQGTQVGKCNGDRKRGWLLAVGVAVGAALAVPTAGMSGIAVGLAAVTIGSLGGARAAQVESDYTECQEKEEKEKKEEAAKKEEEAKKEKGK